MATLARFTIFLTAFLPACAFAGEFRVHPAGFGPVQVGMSVKQASHLLGTPLIKLLGTYQDDRYVVYSEKRFNGIYFRVSSEGNIENAYVGYSDRRFKTDKGIHIGSTAQDITRVYGRLVEVNTYQCADIFHIYIYRQRAHRNYGIKYTVNAEEKVEGIMSGNLNEVEPPC